MAAEYYQTAEALKRTLAKYEAKLKCANGNDKHCIKSMIAKYRSLYKEMLSMANLLERRANGEYMEWR